MFGLLPKRTAVIRSFVTATDCAYVRFARSFDFSLSSSSDSAGAASANARTPAASSFASSDSKRCSGSSSPGAVCNTERKTSQSRAVTDGVDLLRTESGAAIERQQVTEARVVVEIEPQPRRVDEDELARRADLELRFARR